MTYSLSSLQRHVPKLQWFEFNKSTTATHKVRTTLCSETQHLSIYYTASTGNWLPPFPRRLQPQSSAATLKMEAVSSSEMVCTYIPISKVSCTTRLWSSPTMLWKPCFIYLNQLAVHYSTVNGRWPYVAGLLIPMWLPAPTQPSHMQPQALMYWIGSKISLG